MTVTEFSSKPSKRYASFGRPGYLTNDASPFFPAFSQIWAPYSCRGAASAGVMEYVTHPSGRMRSPFHIPSFRYNNPNLAQSRADAYPYDEPTNVPDASNSSVVLTMPIR